MAKPRYYLNVNLPVIRILDSKNGYSVVKSYFCTSAFYYEEAKHLTAKLNYEEGNITMSEQETTDNPKYIGGVKIIEVQDEHYKGVYDGVEVTFGPVTLWRYSDNVNTYEGDFRDAQECCTVFRKSIEKSNSERYKREEEFKLAKYTYKVLECLPIKSKSLFCFSLSWRPWVTYKDLAESLKVKLQGLIDEKCDDEDLRDFTERDTVFEIIRLAEKQGLIDIRNDDDCLFVVGGNMSNVFVRRNR